MKKFALIAICIIGMCSIAEAGCSGSGRAGLFSRFKERRQSASMTMQSGAYANDRS